MMTRVRWLLGCLILLAGVTSLVAGLGVADASVAHKCSKPGSCPPIPPEVKTEAAVQTSSGFELRGELNPEGSRTTYYFIYKEVGSVECEDLEGCGPETRSHRAKGDTEMQVMAEVKHLAPNTTYEYWLVAHNASGQPGVGGRLTFTTPG